MADIEHSIEANMIGENTHRQTGAKVVFDGVELTTLHRFSLRHKLYTRPIPSPRPKMLQSCEMEDGYRADEDMDECDDDDDDHDDATGSFYLPSDSENKIDGGENSARRNVFDGRGIAKQRKNVTSKLSREKRRVTSGKTYAPRSGGQEVGDEPVFKSACKRQHHHIDEDSAVALSAPCVDACCLMELFGMYYCRLGIVCRRCQCLIPPSQLERHIHKSHARTAGTCRMADYKFVATHILESHNLTVSDPDPVLESSELLEPVGGLETPRKAYKCPYCPNKWIVEHTGPTNTYINQVAMVRHHVRSMHGEESIPSEFISRYVLRPYRRYSELRNRVLVLTDGWTPTAETNLSVPECPVKRVYRRQPHPDPGAKFLEDLGWPQYVGSLNASNKRLRQLVQHPSQAFAKSRKSKAARHLELGLCAIYNILLQYFSEANTFAGPRYSQIRQAFVHK
jgi:hypothetical protein